MIAKFLYDSKNLAIVKFEILSMIEILAMIANFLYDSEISLS